MTRPRATTRPAPSSPSTLGALIDGLDLPWLVGGALALGTGLTLALRGLGARLSPSIPPPFSEDIPETLTDRSLAALRGEYLGLYDTLRVRPEREAQVQALAAKAAASRARYEAVSAPLGIPWVFTALVHQLEGGGFAAHLHNGDPLTARTTHEPADRPTTGEPPFTWEESARDALAGVALHTDWTLPGLLWRLEKYNGFGYRPHRLPTPYLWSFSNHYRAGKFSSDGHFDPALVSRQCGAATLLQAMERAGLVDPIPRG